MHKTSKLPSKKKKVAKSVSVKKSVPADAPAVSKPTHKTVKKKVTKQAAAPNGKHSHIKKVAKHGAKKAATKKKDKTAVDQPATADAHVASVARTIQTPVVQSRPISPAPLVQPQSIPPAAVVDATPSSDQNAKPVYDQSSISAALEAVSSVIQTIPVGVDEDVDYDASLVEEEEDEEDRDNYNPRRRSVTPPPTEVIRSEPISLPPPPPPSARLLTVAIPKARLQTVAIPNKTFQRQSRSRSPFNPSPSRQASRSRSPFNPSPSRQASRSRSPVRAADRSRTRSRTRSRSPPRVRKITKAKSIPRAHSNPRAPMDSPRTLRERLHKPTEDEVGRRQFRQRSPPKRLRPFRQRSFPRRGYRVQDDSPRDLPPRIPHSSMATDGLMDSCTPKYSRLSLRDMNFTGSAKEGEYVDRVIGSLIKPMDLNLAQMPLILDGYLFNVRFNQSYGGFDFANWGEYAKFALTPHDLATFRLPAAERFPVPGPMDPPMEHPDFVSGEFAHPGLHSSRDAFVVRFIYGAQLLRATCIVMRGVQFARFLYNNATRVQLPCNGRCGKAIACFAKWMDIKPREQDMLSKAPGNTHAVMEDAMGAIHHAKQALPRVFETGDLTARSYCLYNIARLLYCPCAEW